MNYYTSPNKSYYSSVADILKSLPEIKVDQLEDIILESNEELEKKLEMIKKSSLITPELLNTMFD